MITITDAAIEQIKASARQSDMVGMALRVAASKKEDGSIEYGMGFDNDQSKTDAIIDIGPLQILVGQSSRELLTGATIDYVELEKGVKHFIFINPNDPNHQTPVEPD